MLEVVGSNPAVLTKKEKRKVIDLDQREMFEQSFKRPPNYFQLSEKRQWEIDDELGILDWRGDNMSEEDIQRFMKHYGLDSER